LIILLLTSHQMLAKKKLKKIDKILLTVML
jgi:hypothetical protein